MKNNPPLISIGMPIFNAGSHLLMAVQSIVGQTYANWELLIFDDGSSDGSIGCLEYFRDPRIKIHIFNKNIGLAARLNECVEMASGQYFARMDQDDYSYPTRLKVQIDFLLANPDIDLVAAKYVAIDKFNKFIYEPKFEFLHEKICKNPARSLNLPHPTWMGKRDWFLNNPYAVPAPFLSEDYELLLRTHRSSRFAMINLILLAYRIRYRPPLGNEIKTRIANYKSQKKYLGNGPLLRCKYIFYGFFKVLNAVFFKPFVLKILMLLSGESLKKYDHQCKEKNE